MNEGCPILNEKAGIRPHRLIGTDQVDFSGFPQPFRFPFPVARQGTGDRSVGQAENHDRASARACKHGRSHKSFRTAEGRTKKFEIGHLVIILVLRIAQGTHHSRQITGCIGTREQVGSENCRLLEAEEHVHCLRVHENDVLKPKALDFDIQVS